MKKAILVAGLCVGAVACGGGLTKEAASQQVEQLITLYKENRPKFVVQKQEIVQAGSCDRAVKLREAIGEKAAAAAMSPENSETITLVKMELEQAEKDCLAK